MHLVILAAGRGTRMGPLTVRRNKVMLPVAGRPLIDHLLENAKHAGYRRATVVVNHAAASIEEHLGNGAKHGLDIFYVRQDRPKGTGHALGSLQDHVDGPFVLVAGDNILNGQDLKALAAEEQLALGGRRVDDVRPYGQVRLEDDAVTQINEKPNDAGPGHASAGAYRLHEGAIDAAAKLKPSKRGEIEIPDAIQALIDEGETVRYVPCESWRDATRPWDLLTLQEDLMHDLQTRVDGDVGERVDIEGPIVVEEGARVRNGTTIQGPVVIGSGARVGPNAYLRPATAIGAGCHVGAGVEIKNSILFDRAQVPHLSYVGDSLLATGVNLGAGTQIANLKVTDSNVRVHWQAKEWLDTGRRKFGAVVADDAKVGVNVSINPGTVIGVEARVGAGLAVSGWIPDSQQVLQ